MLKLLLRSGKKGYIAGRVFEAMSINVPELIL